MRSGVPIPPVMPAVPARGGRPAERRGPGPGLKRNNLLNAHTKLSLFTAT